MLNYTSHSQGEIRTHVAYRLQRLIIPSFSLGFPVTRDTIQIVPIRTDSCAMSCEDVYSTYYNNTTYSFIHRRSPRRKHQHEPDSY